MIKATDRGVLINGGVEDVMLDLINIIRSVDAMMTEHYGAEKAKMIIAFCGKTAYMTEEEMNEEVEKIMEERGAAND